MEWFAQHWDYLVFELGSIVLMLVLSAALRRRRVSAHLPVLIWIGVGLALVVGWFVVEHAGQREQQHISQQVAVFAPTYATELTQLGHAQLGLDTAPDDPRYLAMIAAERRWLKNNPLVNDIYTVRLRPDGKVAFVVDSETDYNHDGQCEGERESRTVIGEVYDEADWEMMRALKGQGGFSSTPVTDRWGTWVSAYVPMYDAQGHPEAVLGVDFDAALWQRQIAAARARWIAFFAVLVMVLAGGAMMISRLNAELALRQRSEAALQENEEKYRLLFEQATDGILVADENWNIVLANAATCKMLGYTAEELQRLNVLDTYLPEERNAAEQRRQELGIGKTLNFERNFRRKDGSYFPCEVSVQRMEKDRCQAVFRDITERRRAKESLQLQTSALEAAANAIVITNGEGDIVWVNPAFTTLTGYTREEAIGKNPRILKSDQQPPEFHADMWRAIKAGEVWHGELVNRRKDGSQYTEEMSITPVRNQQGAISNFIAIKQDVTERNRAKDVLCEKNRHLASAMTELRESQLQVIQQERLSALGKMASGVAHDFNNALAKILGFSELLITTPEKLNDPSAVKKHLQMIMTSAEDAANVVRRLREFYRKRRDTEVFAPVNLNAVVEQAISLTEPKWKDQAQAGGVVITVRSALQEVPAIAGNSADLREVLTNLIFNAVDAMPTGGNITLGTRCDGSQVALEVSDTGTGMTEEVKQRCFEPFFSTKGERGTGLGLAILFGVVQRHGGSVAIESELGKGTTFVIRLPIHTGKSAGPALAEPEAPNRLLRVLVVDDEPLLRDIQSEYLCFDGHTVETANDGADALQKFQASRFDLVLTDRAMPNMNGDQLAAAIKRHASQTPVILVTGFGDLMRSNGEKPVGVARVLAKPFTRATLRQAIEEVTVACLN